MANRKNEAGEAGEAGDGRAPRWLRGHLGRRARSLLGYLKGEVQDVQRLCMTQGITPADAGEDVQTLFQLGEHLGLAPPAQRGKAAREQKVGGRE